MGKRNQAATARETFPETEPKSDVQAVQSPTTEDPEAAKKAEAKAAFTASLTWDAKIQELEAELEKAKSERSRALEVVHRLRGAGPHKRDGKEYTIIKRAARVTGIVGYFFRRPEDRDVEEL